MNLDADSNRFEILKAFEDVVSEKSQTNWALFGYEGQTNTLKVVSIGEEGVEEMAEDLNSSKIMYAVIRVIDPNTTRSKFILINWQGEGAPTLRKGACARHLPDVHNIFKGIHITINARTEEEVEPEFIMASLAKASATTYNFDVRLEENDFTTPVGTDYKRTNPMTEINSTSRNKFWEEQEAEEKRRKLEEQKRKEEELLKIENDRKQREVNEFKQREMRNKERNALITASHSAEERANKHTASDLNSKEQWEQELALQQREEAQRALRAHQMRTERKAEAESLIGHRTNATRAKFETQLSSETFNDKLNRPPSRVLKDFNPVNLTPSNELSSRKNATQKTKEMSSRWPPVSVESNEPVSTMQSRGSVSVYRDEAKASTPTNSSYLPKSNFPPHPPIKQPPDLSSPMQNGEVGSHCINDQKSSSFNNIYSPPIQSFSQQQNSASQFSSLQTSSQGYNNSKQYYETSLQKSSKENIAFPVENYSTFQTSSHVANSVLDKTLSPSRQRNYSSQDELYAPAIQISNPLPQATFNNFSSSTSPPADFANLDNDLQPSTVYEFEGIEYQILPEHGLCARALYDYQATDETEITFDPGDIITNIEQIDEGWWQGVGPDTAFGLFPANYVELINPQ